MLRLTSTVMLGFLLLCNAGFAQTNPKLILQTSPNPTEIELKDTVNLGSDGSVTATPVDGSVCQATAACEDVVVKVTQFTSPAAENGNITVNEGTDVELSWKSLGAVECAASGTFKPWTDKATLVADSRDVDTASDRIVATDGASDGGPYELRIQCSNGSVSSTVDATSTLSLVVNKVIPPSPTSCEGREPIKGWTRLTTGSLSCLYGDFSADCTSWSPRLWPQPFVETTTLTRKILTNRSDQRQYVAIGFSTAGLSPKEDGKFNFTSAGGEISQQPIIVTISKCPGDFNPSQPSGCYFNKPLFNFKWRGSESTASTDCVLESDTTYYLNILSSNSPQDTLPADIEPIEKCDSSFCGILIQKN